MLDNIETKLRKSRMLPFLLWFAWTEQLLRPLTVGLRSPGRLAIYPAWTAGCAPALSPAVHTLNGEWETSFRCPQEAQRRIQHLNLASGRRRQWTITIIRGLASRGERQQNSSCWRRIITSTVNKISKLQGRTEHSTRGFSRVMIFEPKRNQRNLKENGQHWDSNLPESSK